MNSAWPRLVIRLDSEVHSDRIDHLKVVEIRPVDSKVPRKEYSLRVEGHGPPIPILSEKTSQKLSGMLLKQSESVNYLWSRWHEIACRQRPLAFGI
jgi:hypothetical protein